MATEVYQILACDVWCGVRKYHNCRGFLL